MALAMDWSVLLTAASEVHHHPLIVLYFVHTLHRSTDNTRIGLGRQDSHQLNSTENDF